MNRKNFIKAFNNYFQREEGSFFNFYINVSELSNQLEFNEKLHQLFLPFFESIGIKNKYKILDKTSSATNYKSYYEEETIYRKYFSVNCLLNINEMYDVIKKIENYPDRPTNIYRIEGIEGRSINHTFFKNLPDHASSRPNYETDRAFLGIFNQDSAKYTNKWNFGFSNYKDLKDWLIEDENLKKLQNIGGVIKRFTVDEDYVIRGEKQLIFQKEEKIKEEIVSWDSLNPEHKNFDINHYKNVSKEDLESEVYRACEQGNLALIKRLLEDKELNIDIHYTEDCFLCTAALYGHLEVVKYLLNSPTLKENCNINDYDGKAFIYACGEQKVEIVKYLLTSHDLKEKLNLNKILVNAMRLACQKDNVELADCLINVPELEKQIDIHQEQDAIFKNALESRARKVIQFLIFDKKIEKTQYIEKLLNEKPNVEVEKWFSLKELNNKLTTKLEQKKIKANGFKI